MGRIAQSTNDTIIPYIKPCNVSQKIINSKYYMDSYISIPGYFIGVNGSYICINMPDESMVNENISRNDYLIINTNADISPFDIVAVVLNNSGNYVIRKYTRTNHTICLLASSHKNIEDIYADDRDHDIEIIGRVEKVIKCIK